MTAELEILDWRRRTAALYAEVRAFADPRAAHARWREGRDHMFRQHPQSPLGADDPLRHSGIPYWPYDPAARFELALRPAPEPSHMSVDCGEDGTTTLHRLGSVALPAPFDASLDVWWLGQYGGGIFLPLRDRTAGTTTYGGGRYLLDTAKHADLGGRLDALTVDLNFLYHPSCRYSPAWTCPLAPAGNTIDVPILSGERLPDAPALPAGGAAP